MSRARFKARDSTPSRLSMTSRKFSRMSRPRSDGNAGASLGSLCRIPIWSPSAWDRPDQVQLIFNRRVSKRTPTRYRTRVITQSVVPSSEKQPVRRSVGGVRSPFAAPDCVTCGYGVFGSLHVDYKHSRIKQYHKEGRAAHRDHHQRQLRLRRRQRAGQFRAAQEAGIYHQSTPVARPTPEPQLPDRRRGVRWPAAAASGARQRPTLHRIAFRLCTGASADGCVAGLPACCHGGSTAPRWRRRSALPWRLGQRDG